MGQRLRDHHHLRTDEEEEILATAETEIVIMQEMHLSAESSKLTHDIKRSMD